jgi:hypothetical protein
MIFCNCILTTPSQVPAAYGTFNIEPNLFISYHFEHLTSFSFSDHLLSFKECYF